MVTVGLYNDRYTLLHRTGANPAFAFPTPTVHVHPGAALRIVETIIHILVGKASGIFLPAYMSRSNVHFPGNRQ
jgi:hypothetical protein